MTTQRFLQEETDQEEEQFSKEKREKRMTFHKEVDLIEEKIHNIAQGITIFFFFPNPLSNPNI